MCFHFVWIFKPDFGIMCLYLVDAVVLVDGTGEVGLVELTLIENISEKDLDRKISKYTTFFGDSAKQKEEAGQLDSN